MNRFDRPVLDHEIDSLQGEWGPHDAWSVLNDVRPIEVHETGPERFTWADLRSLGTHFLGGLIVFSALLVAIVAVSGVRL